MFISVFIYLYISGNSQLTRVFVLSLIVRTDKSMNEGENINSMDALWKNIGYKEDFILLFVLQKMC